MTAAGLDVAALQQLRPPRPTEHLVDRIRAHLDAHDGYVAWSGGKDSTVVLHLARQADPNVPVVFFDSGLEFPETYDHLAELTEAWQLNLQIIPAQPSAPEVLVATGGWDLHAPTAEHRDQLHEALITRPAATAHDHHGPGELWGVRASESRGRRAMYTNSLRTETAAACLGCCHTLAEQRARHGGVTHRRDSTHSYGPIWDWRDHDVWAYLHRHNIPTNPVYAKLRDLGAPEHFLRVALMVDGSRLEHGRIVWLRRGWPDIYATLIAHLPRLAEFA